MREKNFFRMASAVTLAFFMLADPTLVFAQNRSRAQRPSVPAVKVGHASWYSEDDPGVRPYTANREVFDDSGMTCAMWGVPFNQKVRITNLANGKSVIVRVNDRGPHKRFVRKGRVIDLTKSAFQQLASLKRGLIKIKVELL